MNKPWRLPAVSMPIEFASPRRIVFLGSAHDNGGSSILAGNLAAAMRAKGHHVEEWYLFGGAPQVAADVRVFAPGLRSTSPFVLIALFVRVVRALRQCGPDAVFGLQSLSNLMAGIAGGIAGVRQRIATVHNPLEHHNRILMALDRWLGAIGLYSHIVACGQTVGASFAQNGAAYARHIRVIPNGHARPAMIPRAQARRELGLPADGVVLGQIGRLSYQKNQSFALDVLARLPDASLLLVGVGPDAQALKAEIESKRLSERARLVPSIAHRHIGAFYSAIDLMMLPSRFEGLSLAAIEAIHVGVPLLCADIPSFREMFAGSQFLTEKVLLPADPPLWAKRVDEFVNDAALRQKVTDELARISPSFDFDTMAQSYLRLIA